MSFNGCEDSSVQALRSPSLSDLDKGVSSFLCFKTKNNILTCIKREDKKADMFKSTVEKWRENLRENKSDILIERPPRIPV